jgi:geranylgeranyl diphosphate synthase, type I
MTQQSLQATDSWFPPEVAAELGRRLQVVAQHMQHILLQYHLPSAFTALLRQALKQPGKLLGTSAARGQPLCAGEGNLWALPVIVAHAAVAGADQVAAPRTHWRAIAGVAAGAEFLGLALDLIDDLQDGDGMLAQRLGLPLTLNVALALQEMAHAALHDNHIAAEAQARVQGAFASAVVRATGGQYLDIAFERRRQVTVDDAMEMTVLKSGSLIALLYESGAIIGATQAGWHEEQTQAVATTFATLGRHVGTLMQLVNDTQDARETAENVKSDRHRKKKTVPLVAEAGLPPDVRDAGRESMMRIAIEQQQTTITQLFEEIETTYHLRTQWLRWLMARA